MASLVQADRKATVTQITSRYNSGVQRSISERTARRTLKWMGYSSRRPHRVPRTDEQKEKEKMASSADKPLEGNLQGFKICYVQGDLFSCPEKDALAHCISEDCDMEAGIAVWFKWKYGGVEELQNQKKKIGDVAVLKKDQRCIYYLITKKLASDKPTYDAVQKSLKAMRDHCLANGILKISMPKIGCGLDNLEWDKVSAIIEEVFKSTSIVITVYSL